LQANCRFLVSDLADYSAHAIDPDKFLPWGDVAALELTVPVPLHETSKRAPLPTSAHAVQAERGGYTGEGVPAGAAGEDRGAEKGASEGAEGVLEDGGGALGDAGGVLGESVTCPICLEQKLICPQVSSGLQM